MNEMANQEVVQHLLWVEIALREVVVCAFTCLTVWVSVVVLGTVFRAFMRAEGTDTLVDLQMKLNRLRFGDYASWVPRKYRAKRIRELRAQIHQERLRWFAESKVMGDWLNE